MGMRVRTPLIGKSAAEGVGGGGILTTECTEAGEPILKDTEMGLFLGGGKSAAEGVELKKGVFGG